jgi:hypothetical protein
MDVEEFWGLLKAAQWDDAANAIARNPGIKVPTIHH